MMNSFPLRILAVSALVAAVFLPAAQSQEPTAAPTSDTVSATNSMEVLDKNRKLNIGDLLSYRVVEEKGRVSRLIITDSGEMEVPLIGRVYAKGRSCYEVAYSIKSALEAKYFNQATVILALDFAGAGRANYAEAAQEHVTIMGEIGRPGKIPLPAGNKAEYTLSEAILDAGGFARFANMKKVKVVRRKEGGTRTQTDTIIVNLKDIMEKGELHKDVVLKPNDVVIVPEKIFNF